MLTVQQQIIDEFLKKRELRELCPGDKIPSQTLLMRKFSCSRTTVVHALETLRSSGHLQGRQGSGMFVSEAPAAREIRKVLFLAREAGKEFTGLLYAIDTGELSKRYALPGENNRLDNMFREDQAVIWLLPQESMIPWMEHLRRRGIPQLLINRTYGDYDCVYTDIPESIREGLSWLLIESGREIGFITFPPSPEYPYLNERIIAFYENCFLLNAHLMPERIFKTDFSHYLADINRITAEAFFSPSPPRGFFFSRNIMVTPFVVSASRCGKEPGRDYFILTFDEVPELRGHPGIAMLRHPYSLFQLEIENWLKSLKEGQKLPFRKKMKCNLLRE